MQEVGMINIANRHPKLISSKQSLHDFVKIDVGMSISNHSQNTLVEVRSRKSVRLST